MALDRFVDRELLRPLIVAWPRLVACSWLPPHERRTAAFVFYELKHKVPLIPEAELKDILDRTAPLRPSGNLDLRLLGALGRLMAGSPLKPAVALSRSGRIGVIGTRGTLASAKFARLLASLQGQAEFVVQPCDGLAHAIERSTAEPPSAGPAALAASPAATEIRALCARYTEVVA